MIHLVKFIHVIFAISLLGSLFYCVALVSSRKFALTNQRHHNKIMRIHRGMLLTLVLAVATGSLMIYPKNFTLHTPWIQAAYLFTFLFGVGLLVLSFIKKKYFYTRRSHWIIFYSFLIAIIIFLIHGAVTKSVLFFY
jgi:uncharacterized membrane protein